LDSTVHLRYRYGEARRFNAQRALISLVSPRPLCTIFLDIPAETAFARKQDHYGLEQLQRQARLYHEEYARSRAHRLDGEREPADLCAEVARIVTTELGHLRRRPLLRRLFN
jgi:thymidylate kinase